MGASRSVTVLLLGLILFGGAGRLAGQESEPGIRWSISAPKIGYCLHFLMHPDDAAKGLPRGQRLVLAREAPGLPGALQRVISEQPEVGGWVPSEVCVLFPEAIWVDNKRFDKGDGGDHLAVIFWGVASAGPKAAFSIRTLATNSAPLKRAMEAGLVSMQRVDLSVGPISESADERYVLKLEGAIITMDGQAQTDSVNVENVPMPSTAVMNGLSNTVWTMAIELKPTRLGSLPGALRIQGKRGLAEALISSPIRFVDKVFAGGSGEIRFTR